jgi:hypothetical protein
MLDKKEKEQFKKEIKEYERKRKINDALIIFC